LPGSFTAALAKRAGRCFAGYLDEGIVQAGALDRQ
jgi:hypothetical protein